MKKFLSLLVLLVMAVGCTIETPVGFSNPDPINPDLLGSWLENTEDEIGFKLVKLNNTHYSVLVPKGVLDVQITACIKSIGGKQYMDTKIKEDDEVIHQIYGLEILKDGKEVVLKNINEKLLGDKTLNSAQEIEDFIRENQEREDFFKATMETYVRQ